jgi:fatty-acyl-CoA synthase
MHAGTMLKMNALNYPDKLGCQDKNRTFTFKEWDARACQLANGLTRMGIGYQDRFAIIAYNRVEWLEIYGCCAKGGQVMVPVMFRLAPPEIEYNVNHSGCKAFIVEEPFVETINSIRPKLTTIPADHYIYMDYGQAQRCSPDP